MKQTCTRTGLLDGSEFVLGTNGAIIRVNKTNALFVKYNAPEILRTGSKAFINAI